MAAFFFRAIRQAACLCIFSSLFWPHRGHHRPPGDSVSGITPFRYWAFISYSHRNRHWAAWLRRRLEGYRMPRTLVGRDTRDGPLPRRLFPVFRDRDELASSPELGTEIERALQASRYLIVICSPQAAASRWVNEEVRYFKALGREDRVLCLIVDGEPGTGDARECFAPALRWRVQADGQLAAQAAEPVAADVRPQGDGRDRARLKLIAGMLGVGYDELRRRDLATRNRRLGMIALATSLTATLTITLAIAAYVARQHAEHSRQQAEDLISFMLGDLRARLEPVGRLDVLDAVGARAMKYFAEAGRSGESPATLAARAKALRQIGEIRAQQGRLAEAASSFNSALQIDRALALRQPQDPKTQFNLGQSEYWVGYAAWLAGEMGTAQQHFLAYRETALRLLQMEPGKAEWLQELIYGESNLGTLADERGEPVEALQHFEAALDSSRTLLRSSPDSDEFQLNYADALSWVSASQEKLQHYEQAQLLLHEQRDIVQRLVRQHPDDMRMRYRYVLALLIQTRLQARTGQLEQFQARSTEALTLAKTLVKHDPENLDWVETLQQSHALLSISEEQQGHALLALQEAQDSLAWARHCHDHDPQQSHWRATYLRAANRVIDLQLQAHRLSAAAQTAQALAAIAREMQGSIADDLQTLIDYALLDRELAKAQQRPVSPEWSTRLPALIEQLRPLSAAAAESARLRLAVIDGAAVAQVPMPSSLPRCGLEYQRLQRLLVRHGDRRSSDCPIPAALSSSQESRS